MKNLKKALVVAIVSSVSCVSFASDNDNNYNTQDSYQVAMEKLKKTDCSENIQNCRYYAAVEYVAFAQACLYGFEYKFKQPTSKQDIIEIKNLMEHWKAIEEPTMHKAVLYDKNEFKDTLIQKVADYLITVPADDMGNECSRIALIKDQDNPEYMSDILKATKNFKQWYDPIMKKRGLKYLNDNK